MSAVYLPLLELCLELCLEGFATFSCVHFVFGCKRTELEVFLDHEARREQMVVVHVLDERLQTAFSVNLRLRHASGDLARITIDAAHESMSEFLVLNTVKPNSLARYSL